MDRKGRKQFYMWVKSRRKAYDFNYPEGYKPPKGDVNEEATTVVESAPTTDESNAPKLLVPEPGIIVPGSSK